MKLTGDEPTACQRGVMSPSLKARIAEDESHSALVALGEAAVEERKAYAAHLAAIHKMAPKPKPMTMYVSDEINAAYVASCAASKALKAAVAAYAKTQGA